MVLITGIFLEVGTKWAESQDGAEFLVQIPCHSVPVILCTSSGDTRVKMAGITTASQSSRTWRRSSGRVPRSTEDCWPLSRLTLW
ncbi:hypothetical protein MLD38_039732 [Melastoma candidum]|uniref:Uncharacterized protein n=1 Tax=Melastoma candidum TaxID=119954 RepID=A0ACB9L5D2_9MYRT|nr:hypothetical protein MLD38_039732 [Melastoma candidum]